MARSQYADLDFLNVTRILNLPDATLDQQPATFAQLKAMVEGLNWKSNTRVSSSANISVASPGASIGGIAMALNDRVLLRGQTDQKENGLYIWNGAAVPLTRSLDGNASAELTNAIVTVDEGSDAGATFRQTTVDPVIATDNIVFTSFGTVAPAATETTAGIAELATQAETDAGTDDARIVTPLKLATWSNAKKKYVSTVGDGSATTYTLTHNLNTYDLNVEVYRNSGSRDTISCDVARPSVNSVQLTFTSAPTANQFAVVILG